MRKSYSKLTKFFGSDADAKIQLTELNQNFNITQISKKFNVRRDTVSGWFKRLGIIQNVETFKSSLTGRNKKKEPDKTIITKDFLNEEYHIKHKTQSDISNETGIAKWTIQKLFNEYDIPVRKIKNRHVDIKNENKLNDREWLFDQHVNHKKTMIEISNELGVADVTIARKIEEFNIPKNQTSGNYIWKIFKDQYDAVNTLTQLNNSLSLTEISKKYSVDIGTVSLWFKKFSIVPKIHYISTEQKEIHEFVRTIEPNCILNDYSVLTNKEIDVFLPKQRIGIELDGLYWHSTKHIMDKNYHKNKTDLAHEKGVKLYHFYDKEWNDKQEIVSSIISNALGVSHVIYGRKTLVSTITQKQASEFLEHNHIQGKTNSKVHIGLFYINELVSVMSFTPSRFDKSIEWELTRFASKNFTRVIGAASKLLKYFIITHNPKNIVSYADKRISQGDLYLKLGFENVKELKPDYLYFDKDRNLIRKERMRHKYMKHILPNYDPQKSELQNTLNNDIYRVYDCGKLKFIWEPKTI